MNRMNEHSLGLSGSDQPFAGRGIVDGGDGGKVVILVVMRVCVVQLKHVYYFVSK